MDDGTLPQCLLGASLEDEVVSGPPGGMVEWVEGKGRIQAGLWGAEPLESEAFFGVLIWTSPPFYLYNRGNVSLSLRFGWVFCYFCL